MIFKDAFENWFSHIKKIVWRHNLMLMWMACFADRQLNKHFQFLWKSLDVIAIDIKIMSQYLYITSIKPLFSSYVSTYSFSQLILLLLKSKSPYKWCIQPKSYHNLNHISHLLLTSFGFNLHESLHSNIVAWFTLILMTRKMDYDFY